MMLLVLIDFAELVEFSRSLLVVVVASSECVVVLATINVVVLTTIIVVVTRSIGRTVLTIVLGVLSMTADCHYKEANHKE